jgi:signal transduction histidine kinase
VISPALAFIFFIYGLAFFSMGLVVAVEYSRATDVRLRNALRPLAVFGLIHGANEWLDMFWGLRLLPGQEEDPLLWSGFLNGILAFSFLSLAAFGTSLLAPDDRMRRVSLAVPLVMAAIWGFGALLLGNVYSTADGIWAIVDVWTRYVLGIPAALLAAVGLVVQHRTFRRAGLIRFSRDTLWAAIAFAWYGLVGQFFVRESLLPPSSVINQDLFLETFGIPIQLFRAAIAILAAIFVIRFLRSFEYEVQQRITSLQAAQLDEARQREALRGELLKRVVAAQEAERQRIARELHDETGQALTAIGLGLRGVGANLRTDLEKSAQNLKNLERLAVSSLEELQHLISDLRPSHLDELGLLAALRWYASELRGRVDLDVQVEVQGAPHPISKAANTALFRVAQEALTNVVKHAHADCASVRLVFNEASVTLEVDDNGRGFDYEKASRANHTAWGLLGMRERASLLGGNFSLDSRLGTGTSVKVTLPYLEGGVAEDGDDSTAPGG